MAVVAAPRPLLGAVLLLFVSAAWGSAFPLMKDLILRMPVLDLLAERYTIAALALFLLRPRCLRALPKESWTKGIVLGLMFGAGQTAQAVALHNLPSAVSGFAVGCSVVITPVLALILFRARVRLRVWIGVALALAGMAVFTLLKGVEGGEISMLALGLTLAAAALYSGHTLLLARMSTTGFRAYPVTVIQLITIGAMTGVMALPDGLTLPSTSTDWWILAHLSLVSCAIGFLARSYGQIHVPAVPSAVLMSSQPLWVTAFAALWFDERIGLSLLVGGGLTAIATLLTVPTREKPKRRPPGNADSGLLETSRQASKVLAELRASAPRASTGARLPGVDGPAEPLPAIERSARPERVEAEEHPWSTLGAKGGAEPSLTKLVEHAMSIVRAKAANDPVWGAYCLSPPLIDTLEQACPDLEPRPFPPKKSNNYASSAYVLKSEVLEY